VIKMFERRYSYDDLLLVPQKSPVDTRSDVVLDTNVTPNNKISIPLVSAPMDSVTGEELAQKMCDNGGVGIVHRFQDIDKQVEQVKSVDGIVGASIGLGRDGFDSAFMLEEAGADFICVDVAHAHMNRCVSLVEELSEDIDVDVMVGNVATVQGVKDLVKAGADSVKVGVGGGSHCSTREKTGHGVPQASVVEECSSDVFGLNQDYTIIADGGIRQPGDAVKALMLGADAVMMGGIFGRTHESPGDGSVWGCASEEAESEDYVEGEVSHSEEKYSVESVFINFEDGLRSGLSYSGGHSIEEARENAQFIEVSQSTQERNGAFEA
jgi:IMP dehydrogenase